MPVPRVLLFSFFCVIPLVGLSQTEDFEPAPYASEVLTLEQARPLTLVGSSQLRVAFLRSSIPSSSLKPASGMTPVTRSGLSLRINAISPAGFWQSRQRRSGIIWSLMTLDDRSGRQRSWLCGQMSKRATRLRLMSTSKASAVFSTTEPGLVAWKIQISPPRLLQFGCLQKRLGQRTEKVCWPSSRRSLKDYVSPS